MTPGSTELLLSIVTSMGEADGLQSALERALTHLAATCDAPCGEAWLQGKDGLLERRAMHGRAPDGDGAPMRYAPGAGLPGGAFAGSEPKVLGDVPLDDPRRELARRAGLGAAIAAPILAGRRPVGAMVFFLPAVTRASEESLALLRIASAHIGEVICRKQIEHEYAQSLERSNRELEAFASIASHDLQEPLRKIRAFGDRLRSGCETELSPAGAVWLDKIDGCATRMQRMVDELLVYSRLESTAVPMRPVELDLVLGEAVSDVETSVGGLAGRVSLGKLPRVQGDAVMLRSLFQNLVGNALKFHRPGIAPEITVAAESRGDGTCRILVCDNGIGFDPKHAEKIFGMFQRLHARTEYSGTGMGLAICRRIAERHAGEVSATSRPGIGSTFSVVLPLAGGTQ